jgi:glycolate oxidase
MSYYAENMNVLFKKLQESLVGDIVVDQECLMLYSRDKSTSNAVVPKVVVFPEYPDEVKSILDIANEMRTPVTVRGAGTGKSGGAIPEFAGIVISTEKLNKILELDKENACIVVEPGVLTKDIISAAESMGLQYPIIPSSIDWCTIGGNVAENAGAASAIKYGVTGNYVLALEGFTGDGRFFCFGGKKHKYVKDILSLSRIQC